MCGIIAVLRRPSTRAIPEASEILTLVGQAQELLKKGDLPSLAEANELLKEADHLLRGGPGLLAFFSAPELADHLYERIRACDWRGIAFLQDRTRAALCLS